MNPSMIQWAIRNGVSAQALAELREMFGAGIPQHFAQMPADGKSEAAVQARVRLEGARKDNIKLFRNNVGALLDSRGVPVRYGLANETPAQNKVIKSADLIGWRSVLITPAHVGSHIAQFLSRECKEVGWTYSGTEHERAQMKWIEHVTADGGDAQFCSDVGSL